MYSIVMLMAMSTGGEVADCHHSCCGCYGGCYGCYGGCYGCYGCSGCYGCYGCYGGCYGCSGCYGCYGCYGGTIINGGTEKKEAPATEEGQSRGITRKKGAPARLIVSLPAKAKLSINGSALKKSEKTRRVFVSPKLDTGREYYYNLKVVVEQDGKPVTLSKRVTVRAGSKVNVELTPASSVALR